LWLDLAFIYKYSAHVILADSMALQKQDSFPIKHVLMNHTSHLFAPDHGVSVQGQWDAAISSQSAAIAGDFIGAFELQYYILVRLVAFSCMRPLSSILSKSIAFIIGSSRPALRENGL
jgi:hypothetical protein